MDIKKFDVKKLTRQMMMLNAQVDSKSKFTKEELLNVFEIATKNKTVKELAITSKLMVEFPHLKNLGFKKNEKFFVLKGDTPLLLKHEPGKSPAELKAKAEKAEKERLAGEKRDKEIEAEKNKLVYGPAKLGVLRVEKINNDKDVRITMHDGSTYVHPASEAKKMLRNK